MKILQIFSLVFLAVGGGMRMCVCVCVCDTCANVYVGCGDLVSTMSHPALWVDTSERGDRF
jgi:hypothetical protein